MQYIPDLVSILLPVRNASATLSECLDSLQAQTYDNLEVIIIDDFSRDDTYKIASIYRKKDRRVRLYRNVKQYGAAVTLNRALKRAKGQYVTFMDAKDTSTPDRIKRQLSYFRDHPKTVAVGTQCIFMDDEHKNVGKSAFPQEHDRIYNRLINGVTMQFETALINRFRLPKDLLHFSQTSAQLHLSDIFVKIQQYGSFANINQCLYKRYKASQTTMEKIRKQLLPQTGLFIKAIFEHDYRPSVEALVSPLIKQLPLNR
jgi:glycosyltransferase involved in cell wall biosynthesis